MHMQQGGGARSRSFSFASSCYVRDSEEKKKQIEEGTKKKFEISYVILRSWFHEREIA